MRAVLLFSAALHIAALGCFVAYAMNNWVSTRRPKEPTFHENISAAFVLGGIVVAVGTIMMRFFYPFGFSFRTGLVAGTVAGLSFLLYLGAAPGERPAHGGEGMFAFERRMLDMALVAVLAGSQLVAFCFLVSALQSAPA